MQIFKISDPNIPQERFRMFVGSVIGSLTIIPNANRMEQSVYEDFTRKIAGPEAYLLFVFDRLISQVRKNFKRF